MFLPQEIAHFVLGTTPVLLVGRAVIHQDLPVLHAPDSLVPSCEGWQVMAKLTLTLVDGPGEAGCVVPGIGAAEELDDRAAWCDAVEAASGAVVISVETMPEQLDWDDLFTGGRARGGFMPAM